MSGIIDREAVQAIVGYKFHDHDLVEAALTHPSAIEGKVVEGTYERLEFLGDSILGAIVAAELYRRFPGQSEGALSLLKTSIVSGETLSAVAGKLGLGKLIAFGDSELGSDSRGMHSALENVFEAIVGALYLDGGAPAAHAFVMRELGPLMTLDAPQRLAPPKSRLQEICQGERHSTVEYKLVGQEGPAHRPTFTSVVLINGARKGRGTGSSKKESESNAARDALARMGYQVEFGEAGSEG